MRIIVLGILTVCLFAAWMDKAPAIKFPMQLSAWELFAGDLSDLTPGKNVLPYEVNMPLFSDYAEKSRFIRIPEGQKMKLHPTESFHFPEGTVLVKNFFYYQDKRSPKKGRRIIETRLLVLNEKGWQPLTYIWNDAQTDAMLEVAGGSTQVQWRDDNGKKRKLEYFIPNRNQCKGCHSFNGEFTPLGTTWRQLHNETNQQLDSWAKQEKLHIPDDFNPDHYQALPEMDANGTALKARAYLDANCGHCHRPEGPASTSGLYLHFTESNPEHLGVNKPPVAAGRGSGNRKFSIVPGKPRESILLYRMESDDPGIRMPEIGRQLAHKEGIELVKEWIRGM